MTIWRAILVGQLIVNVAATIIMIAVMFLGSRLVPGKLHYLAAVWSVALVVVQRASLASLGDPERLRSRSRAKVRRANRFELADRFTV